MLNYSKIRNTRETPAFGGISFAFRGSDVFGSGKGNTKKNKNWGAMGASLGAAAYNYYTQRNRLLILVKYA